MIGRKPRKTDQARPEPRAEPAPVPDVDESAPSGATRLVHITDPGRGPVHVDDGPPLTHPDTRNVSDSPLTRAYLDCGVLAETSRGMRGKETT